MADIQQPVSVAAFIDSLGPGEKVEFERPEGGGIRFVITVDEEAIAYWTLPESVIEERRIHMQKETGRQVKRGGVIGRFMTDALARYRLGPYGGY